MPAAYTFDDIEILLETFSGSAAPAVSATGKARIYYDTTRNQLLKSENGGPYVPLSGGNIVSVTLPYTATVADSLILANGTFPVTLPPAASAVNIRLTVKNIGTGVITITPNGTELIDGVSSYVMPGGTGAPQLAITVASNGVNWFIV